MKLLIFQKISYWIFFLFFKIFFKTEIKGRKNISFLKEKRIIFAIGTHASYLDGLIATFVLGKDFLPLRFLVNEKYFRWSKNPLPFPVSIFSAWFLRNSGCVPIKINGKNSGLRLRGVIKILKEDPFARICIFPEGSLSKDGKLQPIRNGVFLLSKSAKSVIVPVGIRGNHVILKTFFMREKIVVKIGEPLHFANSIQLGNEIEKLIEETDYFEA